MQQATRGEKVKSEMNQIMLVSFTALTTNVENNFLSEHFTSTQLPADAPHTQSRTWQSEDGFTNTEEFVLDPDNMLTPVSLVLWFDFISQLNVNKVEDRSSTDECTSPTIFHVRASEQDHFLSRPFSGVVAVWVKPQK